uniref:RRM domain-containing protein n=1 Tax=Timema genevievae TaxID=629358 RepID=A0A7R9K1N3_TIMGE|nr:unnamed protein product [Timema genevievae]
MDISDRIRDRSPLRLDDRADISHNRDSSRDRDRSRRGDRPSRFGPRNTSPVEDGDATCRVFVSNIPYEFGWQDLKDLFRREEGDLTCCLSLEGDLTCCLSLDGDLTCCLSLEGDLTYFLSLEVGKVDYVELFKDENDKARGCGIVKFETPDLVNKAIEKMHRYELNNRNLVVKQDFDSERDKYGRLVGRGGGGGGGQSRGGGGGGGQSRGGDHPRGGDGGGGMPRGGRDESPRKWGIEPSLAHLAANIGAGGNKWGNTYGLSPQFLESLWITGPLVNRVFVANLDYQVDNKKLKEVFKLAGKVEKAQVSLDKEGKSRGFGVVEFDHPVEAVQAISMLHNQMLYERKLTVRMDRVENKIEGPPKLPEGLRGIGMGLGTNGYPLNDVARNLPSAAQGAAGLVGAMPQGTSLGGGLGAAALVGQSGLVGLGGAANLASAAGLGNLSAASFLGSNLAGTGDLSLANLANLPGAFGASGLTASLNAAAGLGAGGNSASYLGVSGGGGGSQGVGHGYGGGNTGGLGSGFGNSNRDFDSLSAALGGGGGAGSSYASGAPQRDYRSVPAEDNYSNGPSRAGLGATCLLAPTVTWQMLRDKFHEIGDVKFAELRGKDMGLVRFVSDWDAERAVRILALGIT